VSQHNVQGIRRARLASAATLTLACIGAASLAAELLLESLRRSDECRTAITFALDGLIWTALASSALALFVGVVALISRSEPRAWTVGGLSLALVIGGLVFIPGVVTYVCGASAA
jgi:hypothetical protein